MNQQLIECVPNFSEGNDMQIIKQITDQIESVEGVRLIDVDPGKATNRTVVTFVGQPEVVIEAAFLAIKKAGELIQMAKHKGAHPRFGATDVCPLVPVANISMEETVKYAHKLAERVGRELGIPVYCYEFAASEEKRKNLANCRAGEYEGLTRKLADPAWKPDYGPAEFNNQVSRTGASAIGARNFLIAYNINLNTTSTRRANSIAFDIREKGRIKREGGGITGTIVKDEYGNPVYEPGMLKCVKGIGWYIEEYGIAQLSFNLTDITVTTMHQVFEAACQRAEARGLRVTGSELIGVIPLQAMLDAGKYFLKKQQRSTGIADSEIIKIAVKSLGLSELSPFNPQKKIIEYLLSEQNHQLVDKSLKDFLNETASESPAPGGGSISASMAAMAAALGSMVANLSAHKRGWDHRWVEFSAEAEKGKYYMDKLTKLVDEDTEAFNKIMDAFSLPKKTEQEIALRKESIKLATKYAIEVPLQVMHLAFETMQVIKSMAEKGNPNSVTDAGVAALAARSGVLGAFLNVKINAKDYPDKDFVEKVMAEGKQLESKTIQLEKEILELVESKIKN
ncbi:MAG: glutamate formimidoyltransferase [Bacteroidota bacterium]|nr:MAG: glutamate formimidoyltransferase [Bacteroidota bacterium]